MAITLWNISVKQEVPELSVIDQRVWSWVMTLLHFTCCFTSDFRVVYDPEGYIWTARQCETSATQQTYLKLWEDNLDQPWGRHNMCKVLTVMFTFQIKKRKRTFLGEWEQFWNKVPSFGCDTEYSHHFTKYMLVILKTENSWILSRNWKGWYLLFHFLKMNCHNSHALLLWFICILPIFPSV